MTKSLIVLVSVLVFMLAVVYSGCASPVDDAKALAEKAAEYIKTNGKEKGLAEINNPKGQFVKGDIYVVAGDLKGFTLAHPVQPKTVGMNLLSLKDPNDKPFMQEVIDIARTKGSGWVTYTWSNSGTKKMQPKKSWVRRVEGQDVWVMCGVWQ